MTKTVSFDESVFRELGDELGAEDTAMVLNTFLADTANRLLRLEAGGEVRSAIRREAHSIKSSAATFGFGTLSQVARDLEAGAEAMPQAALRESVQELRRAFEATRTFAQDKLLNPLSGAAA